MYLEIISPEKTLFKGEVESVLFPGTYGDFQVLNNHAPIVHAKWSGHNDIIVKQQKTRRLERSEIDSR